MLANLFQTEQDSLEKNPEDPDASLFSILGSVEKFRNEEGKFVFKIVYPELKGLNLWEQTSNPATAETIEGFQGLRLNFSEAGDGGDWGGLGKCSHSSALICDAPSQDTEETLAMCIGCGRYARAAGKEIRKIPGPKHSISAVSKVELYAGVAKRTRNTTIGQCGEWTVETPHHE